MAMLNPAVQRHGKSANRALEEECLNLEEDLMSTKKKALASGGEQPDSMPVQAPGSRLKAGERLAYGCGDTACNIVFGMISTLLTLFYTDYAGISVATVGLVMLISRIFDGTSDVIMGLIVNRTNSKWGKARRGSYG